MPSVMLCIACENTMPQRRAIDTGKAFPFILITLPFQNPLTASAHPVTAKTAPRIRINMVYSLVGLSPPCVFHLSVRVHNLNGDINSKPSPIRHRTSPPINSCFITPSLQSVYALAKALTRAVMLSIDITPLILLDLKSAMLCSTQYCFQDLNLKFAVRFQTTENI